MRCRDADGVHEVAIEADGEGGWTVDGRVAASWQLERARGGVRLTVTPHTEIRRAARAQIRAEAERTARFCEPEARSFEAAGV